MLSILALTATRWTDELWFLKLVKGQEGEQRTVLSCCQEKRCELACRQLAIIA